MGYPLEHRSLATELRSDSLRHSRVVVGLSIGAVGNPWHKANHPQVDPGSNFEVKACPSRPNGICGFADDAHSHNHIPWPMAFLVVHRLQRRVDSKRGGLYGHQVTSIVWVG